METKELINALKPNIYILIKNEKYRVLQHIVWWQAKSNENYHKYVLEDESRKSNYRLFISGETIGMSTIFHHPFQEPMPQRVNFEGKDYKLSQDEFCIVKRCEGRHFYKVGDAEIWWDYIPVDGQGNGLSLGRNWETWEREDLKTQELKATDIIFLLGLKGPVNQI